MCLYLPNRCYLLTGYCYYNTKVLCMLSYTGLHLAKLLLSWTEPALSYQNGGIILQKWHSAWKDTKHTLSAPNSLVCQQFAALCQSPRRSCSGQGVTDILRSPRDPSCSDTDFSIFNVVSAAALFSSQRAGTGALTLQNLSAQNPVLPAGAAAGASVNCAQGSTAGKAQTCEAQPPLPAGQQQESSLCPVRSWGHSSLKEQGLKFTVVLPMFRHLAKDPTSWEQLGLADSIKKLDRLEGSLRPEKNQNPSKSCPPSTPPLC